MNRQERVLVLTEYGVRNNLDFVDDIELIAKGQEVVTEMTEHFIEMCLVVMCNGLV